MPHDETSSAANAGVTALLSHPAVVIFALCVTLLHFANAALLPLAGQFLSHDKVTGDSLHMSACFIAAQLVMIPVGIFAGGSKTLGP